MVPERLKAFVRRTVAYNRQPHRLVALPFQLVAGVLATYLLFTGFESTRLVLAASFIGPFSMVLQGVWWFGEHVVAGYRGSTPKPR